MTTEPKRVLVVEDNSSFRNMLVRTLQRAGYDAVPAEDFSTAIEIIEREENLHLLLIDVQMPPGTPNGVTLGRMARLRRQRLPMIYMTGAYDLNLLAGVLGSNIPILRKPFRTEELIRTIEAALNK